jgi:hypothetical protein
MLDVQGYKSTEEDTREFDSLAREILGQDTASGASLDTLVGHDRNGRLWIYASQEAKLEAQAAHPDVTFEGTPGETLGETPGHTPGHTPGQTPVATPQFKPTAIRPEEGMISRAESEPAMPLRRRTEEGYSYAKTLRLTSEQLVPRKFSVLTRNRLIYTGGRTR